MPEFDLVLVEWRDSYGCSSSWQDVEDCNAPALFCHSVGWLVHKNKDCIVLVPHLTCPVNGSMKQQGCGDMTIPTASITKLLPVTISNRQRKR